MVANKMAILGKLAAYIIWLPVDTGKSHLSRIAQINDAYGHFL
jgi:hypothetical protein